MYACMHVSMYACTYMYIYIDVYIYIWPIGHIALDQHLERTLLLRFAAYNITRINWI